MPTCVLAETTSDDVSISSSSVDEAQNQVIEELKKQNEDMKALMEELKKQNEDMKAMTEELSRKLLRQEDRFEEKLTHQEQKLVQQEEETASLRSEIATKLDDIRDITENSAVSENGRK